LTHWYKGIVQATKGKTRRCTSVHFSPSFIAELSQSTFPLLTVA
jgi:hypothetical protein